MTTEFANGEPSWVDLASTDIPASQRFYQQLFGWDYQDLGEQAGNYNFILAEGEQVGGLGPLMDPTATPTWTTYFQAGDAHAITGAVDEAGGVIRYEPMDVMGQNVIAGFTDPQGGEFAVTQPKAHKGAERWGPANSVCWVEYSTRDVAAAVKFYTRVFGWNVRESDFPGMSYLILSVDGGKGDFGAIMENNEMPADRPPYWMVYFTTPDVDGVAAKTTDLGGMLAMPPNSMERVGRLASMTDPAGVPFAVIDPDPS